MSYHANGGEAKGKGGMFGVGAAQIEWEVSFRCPGCGEVIFPEDAAGRYYSLLEVKIEEREIREAVIRCAKCGSLICLESFDLLNRLGCSHESGDVERRPTNIAVEADGVPPPQNSTDALNLA